VIDPLKYINTFEKTARGGIIIKEAGSENLENNQTTNTVLTKHRMKMIVPMKQVSAKSKMTREKVWGGRGRGRVEHRALTVVTH